jgi:hypothetical protein
MKMKFTDEEDLKQACYEAAVDLVPYIDHIMSIAQRAKENFPEVANGLEGAAAGITQHLRGLDGKWKTSMNEGLHAVLARPEFEDHAWAYEFCRDPRGAVMLMGALAAFCAAKPESTFWEALKDARESLSRFEPLIQSLLNSSPLRKPQ